MKKCLSIFSLFTIATLFLFGCRKGGLTEDQVENTVKRKGASTETLVPPDVYVAGTINSQAVVWKNGVATALTGGIEATGIVVVGTDVYICGSGIHPTTRNNVAMYWKNGVQTVLSDGSNIVRPNGIAVSGSDVYVSAQVDILGYESVYYLNGVAHSLTSTTNVNRAWGVVTDGNGNSYIPGAREGFPSYWKNGTLEPMLPNGPNTHAASCVKGMAIQGTHVYAVGNDYAFPTFTPLYWKDNQVMPIGGTTGGYPQAVAVKSNGDAVIAGTYDTGGGNTKLAYWSMLVPLDPPVILTTSTYVGSKVGIAVDQTTDDVYICGSDGTVPKYWNNGIATILNSSGAANAIALGY